MNNIIFSVFHKPYTIPEDTLYQPIQVGFGQTIINPNTNKAIIRDNSGINISNKNKNYCELTALYWIWKNIGISKYDYIGLDHYRRHFTTAILKSKSSPILSSKELGDFLKKNAVDIILPKKRHYWIETNYSQYVHAHHKEDLEITREAIKLLCPDFLPSYDNVMKKTNGHRFNMFIMRSDILNEYCTWLFPILEYVEEHIDISNYSDYDARIFGFIGERLLDVWLLKTNYTYKDISYIFEDPVNWIKKIASFLKRRFKKS